MNIIALLVLSLGMSMDAFAAAIAKGSMHQKHTLLSAFKIGVIFGIIEALTPLIGYGLGVVAEGWVSRFDHWLAFVLLGGLGVYLIYEAVNDDTKEHLSMPAEQGLKLTILTAFATSIDALVIGISLAFVQANIWLACLMIGTATTVMATIGVYLGAILGDTIGKTAEVLGGVVLIGIGSFILWSHLNA